MSGHLSPEISRQSRRDDFQEGILSLLGDPRYWLAFGVALEMQQILHDHLAPTLTQIERRLESNIDRIFSAGL